MRGGWLTCDVLVFHPGVESTPLALLVMGTAFYLQQLCKFVTKAGFTFLLS